MKFTKYNKMSKKEIKELDGKRVICVYSNFYEKTSGEAWRDREAEHVPFGIITLPLGEWRSDGNLIIYRDKVHKFIRGGRLGDEVITTSIYKRI